MNTYWLKRVREKSWKKYEVRRSEAGNAGDKPWCIYTGPNTCLAYHEYATREAAEYVCKLLWHEEAEKFLWDKRDKRKKNKYPW